MTAGSTASLPLRGRTIVQTGAVWAFPGADDQDERVEDEPSIDALDLRSSIVRASDRAAALAGIVDERTIDIDPRIDEDAFFTADSGGPTVTNRYDLEKAVPTPRKGDLQETDRYWVNKPYAFAIVFSSRRENEAKYYLVEPSITPVEEELCEFLAAKLRSTIKYSQRNENPDKSARAAVIEREVRQLLGRYGLLPRDESAHAGAVSSEPLRR